MRLTFFQWSQLYYRKDFRQLVERFFERLLRSKGTILTHSIQWISISVIIFLLIYAAGTLGLNSIKFPDTGSVESDIRADYGEWVVLDIPRIDPEIIIEIKRDNPQNPEVFKNPELINSDEDPFIIIRDQPGNNEAPILETPKSAKVYSEPTISRSPGHSPTLTPAVSLTPTPTPTLILTITPMSTPPLTQSPTNTTAPPTPTLPPSPTDQSLVKVCHKPGEPNQRSINVPPVNVEDHLAHGDYLGECTNH